MSYRDLAPAFPCPHFQPELTAPASTAGLHILDQTQLPFIEHPLRLDTLAATAVAIRDMQVRGAPLIGATAAFGVAFAMREDASNEGLNQACALLAATRPTAVNLHWALARQRAVLSSVPAEQRVALAWNEALRIATEDSAANARIGQFGLREFATLLAAKRARGDESPLQVMTHCNAGWLACTAHGTALSPIYATQAAGLPVKVWVSETRPRNQGLLTAWELARSGVAHTLIADNAAGWLMASGQVDAVIVGADRIAANGDTANKVGTYLKALAAAAHRIPFYVAAPLSTYDPDCPDGQHIPIEERSADELRLVTGLPADDGEVTAISRLAQVTPATAICNPAFDVTPHTLVTRVLTEKGCHYTSELESLL